MSYTPPSIEGDHVVITGPITGFVTLADGTRIDVSQPHIVAASQDQAVEVAHLIGLHWAAPENVHPGQVDVDDRQPRTSSSTTVKLISSGAATYVVQRGD